jgi:hypothetical protein
MDDFMLLRFALDNVRVPEIAATASEALDRIIQGRAHIDPDTPDGRSYERARRRRNEAQPSAPAKAATPGPRLSPAARNGSVGRSDGARRDLSEARTPGGRPEGVSRPAG